MWLGDQRWLALGDYGAHFLRRTTPSIIYKATGNLRAVQIPLGHTKIKSHGSLSRRQHRGHAYACEAY
jgi:hypothetical protein